MWENLQWLAEEKAVILLTLKKGDTGSQSTTGTLSDVIWFNSLEVIHVRQLQISQEVHIWNVFLWHLHILKVKLVQKEKSSYQDSLYNRSSNTAGLFLLLLSGALGMTHPGTPGSTAWPSWAYCPLTSGKHILSLVRKKLMGNWLKQSFSTPLSVVPYWHFRGLILQLGDDILGIQWWNHLQSKMYLQKRCISYKQVKLIHFLSKLPTLFLWAHVLYKPTGCSVWSVLVILLSKHFLLKSCWTSGF